jgi:hypothetical protein
MNGSTSGPRSATKNITVGHQAADEMHVAPRPKALSWAARLPREARRMITEKHTAYSHAQIAGVYALLTGGPVEAGCEMIKIYELAVAANCVRLSAR